MNDLELVRRLNRELIDDYQLARNYCLDVPTYALVHLRSVAHRLVEQIAALKQIEFRSKNLYDRIDQLGKTRLIDMRLTRKLHKLRNDGNKGAHPEKYQLSQQQLVLLATKSVKDCANLCADLYPLLAETDEVPEWQFAPVDAEAGRELCYRAVMDDDAEAQYLVGLSLKARAAARHEQELSFAEANETQLQSDSSDELTQAAYWFERAALRHAGARFEHGVALLHGYGGEMDEALALELIQAAAEEKNADAQALVGYFHLTGSHGFSADPQLAEHYLLAGAEQEQPEALANLAVLYYKGLLGQADYQQARRCAEQGAQAGYPHAQYQLAVMLFAGEGGTVDALSGMQWLQSAAEQHYPEALADLAQRRLDGDGIEANAAAAEALYQQAIEYGALPRAMFELALAHFEQELPQPDLNLGAQLLWQAYQRVLPQSELGLAIHQLAPELVAQLDSAIEAGNSELQAVRRRFSVDGYPQSES
ncbi:tetratricopeptide repeat protein [Ferrimonas lipolytica]|uniref:DUF4145 domain-containing protein n=1 Tax=Ferrimonas lipolytica TaxID=2724191 RepID=A0A6H1UGC7_9GAMM|nr:tetratricopeptide repeat protein [Ferrimonas lipolytica]QIZ78157.1 DUF4145 domain-containing protein [Ferrimonas lipolytica]